VPVADVARHMLDTYPREFNVDRQLLVRCIEACCDCAETCTQCADDCLSEQTVQELAKCIRLNLDCADVCTATGRVVSRQTGFERTSPAPCCGRASRHAAAAATSASCTATTGWSTAWSALRNAVVASRRAKSC
jgi:hypothetical protein